MKADIHPAYHPLTVKCSCGYEFVTGSSLSEDSLTIEVCSNCHPYYTGKQRIVDTEGRVEKFNQRFVGLGQKKPAGQAKSPAKLGTVKRDKE